MTITNSSLRLVALVTGVAVAIALMGAVAVAPAQAALTQTQIQSIVGLLASFGADQATINNVTAALNGQATPGTGTGGGACPALTRSLQQGSSGADVKALQVFLNGSATTQVSVTGAGSPGNESTFFGSATKAASIKFQAANNVDPIGIVGPATRAAIAAVCGTGNPNPTPGPTTGGSVSVSAGAQPVNSLAPSGASRVPFTTFTLTNNSSAEVTVNSVTVQRTGLAVDGNLSGIVLLDSNGLQIGTAKTLNSNHQANLDGFTIAAGQSMTLTVAGNISSTGAQSGQVLSIQVVAINTGATVSGSLPITGASQTINTTLTLGSVSTSTSSFDPGVAQTKNIGDMGVRFAGTRFTAGSAEDIKLYSIRWRQTGSASAADLTNVMTNINGTDYPTTLDSTGKYYTTVVSGGLMITKGNSVDVYVKGDITGSNSSGRNIAFDIDKSTDVYFIGQTYGYGVAVSGSYTPWYDAYLITVAGGTATTIGKANSVAAQNIAVNVQNQPLGGFTTDFKGEPVSTQSMVFTVATSSASTGLLTSVSIVNANGSVVAGPIDATWVAGVQTLTFSDTVTFPVGVQTYTVKGKVPSGANNGATITLSTTPSSWTSVTGQTSGNTITISQGAFSMNTMTVKAASLAVAISTTPSAQTIVAGAQGVEFSRVQLDASQSGEDVRLSSLTLTENGSTNGTAGASSNLSSCQLFDGATTLNGGSNVVNPSTTATTSAVTATFTFDNTITIAKGTVKELSLKCNVTSSAHTNSTYQWGITSAQVAALGSTGFTSGNSITETGATNNGQLMTVASTGSTVASTDSSSPSYAVAAGASNVTLGTFKLRATNEGVNLERIGLKLTNTASSSASDLTQVQLWANGVQIGTATFVGSNRNATSTLTSALVLPKDTDVVVTVKGDIAAIGSSQPGTTGQLVAVDIDTNSTNTQGSGAQSGATVNVTGSTAVAGVRIFKSFPVLAKATVPTNTLNNGTQSLLRFTVTANSKGDVGIGKVTLRMATTTASVTDVNVYAFTDSSYSTPVSGLRSDGGILATDILATGNATWASSATDLNFVASTPVQVPASATRYFEVRGTVASATTGASVQTSLQGDAAYPALAGNDDTLTNIDADTNDDFIWSPNTTGTSVVGDADWTNGFGLLGLPSSNMASEVLSK